MAQRRKNGEGSIRFRKDGRWEGRYTVGYNAQTGKPISKSIMGSTYEDISLRLKNAISEVGKHRNINSCSLSVSEWVTVWFETYSKPVIRESTVASYDSNIRNHIIPNIGLISLTALSPFDIQMMYNKMKESGRVRNPEKMPSTGLSSSTIRSVHSLLRQCLEQAVCEGIIPHNPVANCRLPPKHQEEMKVISPEKVGAYLKAADEHDVLALFFLALSSGMRRGELLALLWSDLNVIESTISVSKQVTGGKGRLVVSAPKTSNSIRTIAIPKQATSLLVAEHYKHPESPFLFPSPKTGNMYYPDSIGRLHKRILSNAGLEKIRFHDLRHTFATLAIQNGVDIKTLSSMLGHCSAGFTLDTYAHVTDKMQREAANKLGKFMKQVAPVLSG